MRIISLIAAATALLPATPALAQVPSARLTLDAGATFDDAPDPPLELKVSHPISFGRVTVPNALNPKSVCRYEVTTSRGGLLRMSDDETVDGAVVANSVAGCAFVAPATYGIVELKCTEGVMVNYTIAFNPGSFKGALFSAINSVAVGEYTNGNSGGRRFGNLLKSGSFQCITEEGNGSGKSILYFSAMLQVTDVPSLPRGSAVSVGTVQIDMSY